MRAASSIQRIKKDSSLGEPQPPPYQHEGSGACVGSRSRSERGIRRAPSTQHCDSPHCSSEASGDQDTESYLNKACDEDIPSDSTAVLGPEVGDQTYCLLSFLCLSSLFWMPCSLMEWSKLGATLHQHLQEGLGDTFADNSFIFLLCIFCKNVEIYSELT